MQQTSKIEEQSPIESDEHCEWFHQIKARVEKVVVIVVASSKKKLNVL